MSQGGHNREECVHERVQCHVHVFLQCHSVTEEEEGVCRGSTAGLVKGLLLTVDSGGSTVKSTVKSTVSLQLVNGVQKGLQ